MLPRLFPAFQNPAIRLAMIRSVARLSRLLNSPKAVHPKEKFYRLKREGES